MQDLDVAEYPTRLTIEIIIICFHLVYAVVTIILLVKIKKRYKNKLLYPYVMTYGLLLSTNYLSEIMLSIARFLEATMKLLMVFRTVTIVALHSAYITLMYGTLYSIKYILIIAQNLRLYYLALFAIVLNILLIVAYVGTRIVLSIIRNFKFNQYEEEEAISAAVYGMYTIIMLLETLVKRHYQYQKYLKRRAYRWSIVISFLLCTAAIISGMVILKHQTHQKFTYDSVVNIFIDALPIYCTLVLLSGYKKKAKRVPPADSFFSVSADENKSGKQEA
eukprot:TRINITY_DN6613_c0_g1_i6.p1 TRINITY_DN6613_c0_g1~~TRINITY_DN6613_c0_g1_i6.p1  ORF type:complete len:305 (+),score=72.31 TRINITY_DN6613_c0_g1_i6:87-917(+)